MQESIPSGQTVLNLPLPPELQIPPEAGCAHCGSSRIEPFESYGPTGVYAPDGGAEHTSEEGVQCVACGAKEPEAEPRHWLAEAFQIVAGRSPEWLPNTSIWSPSRCISANSRRRCLKYRHRKGGN